MKNADRVPALALAGGAVLAVLLAFTLHLPQRLVSAAGTSSVHRLDGRVTSGEYRFRWTDDASKLVFQWSIVGDRLIGAVTSPDTGWVAVGFGGEGPLMYGADIVIGYVDAHGAHVEDHYANTPTSHVADTALGGHDDILGSAGLRTAAGTTIEFERPLASHDSTDRPIVAGQMHVIMASSESPDLMAYHVEGHKAVALLDMFNGPPAAAGAGALLPDHLTDVQIMIAA
ncbi:MAG TPA: DOMON domain-containing protein, partial [Streptosporangiaceae bacterium]|nr:DOMON domain-containing protein [Streptosporangiaceae bacterium]